MVYSALILLILALSAFGQSQFISAPVITGNQGGTYTATLRNSPSLGIRGTVTASSGPGGTGLSFQVSFTGLPADLGPFPYHIHVSTVPANGSCQAAGSHLDPYNRGEQPPCDSSDPATCQIGDLSGKHGNATTQPTFSAQYTDLYLSNNPGSNAFIGNRSIVIHDLHDNWLNCGNFELVSGGGTSSSSARFAPAAAGKSTSTAPSPVRVSPATHPTTTATSPRQVSPPAPTRSTTSSSTLSVSSLPSPSPVRVPPTTRPTTRPTTTTTSPRQVSPPASTRSTTSSSTRSVSSTPSPSPVRVSPATRPTTRPVTTSSTRIVPPPTTRTPIRVSPTTRIVPRAVSTSSTHTSSGKTTTTYAHARAQTTTLVTSRATAATSTSTTHKGHH